MWIIPGKKNPLGIKKNTKRIMHYFYHQGKVEITVQNLSSTVW